MEDSIIRGIVAGDARITVASGDHGIGGTLSIFSGTNPMTSVTIEITPERMRDLAEMLNERAAMQDTLRA